MNASVLDSRGFVSVVPHKFVHGWPRHEHGERAHVLPLGRALQFHYSTDAHFSAYVAPNARRLTREAIDQLTGIELTCVVFDVDSETHGKPDPAPESWRRELRAKVQALCKVHPDPYCYETRGGARIVYVQDEPTILRSQDDAQQWSQVYAVAIAYLQRRFGIVADVACQDWQRLYRLPYATRSAGGPENWPTYGDANRIGTLTINATRADVARAKRISKAFRERTLADLTPSGEGLLYHALHARGDIIREHNAGAFVIRCPREREHSTGRTGDGSTLLYLPARGAEIGAICCLHSHCIGLRARDWLSAFSYAELEAARCAAGITRAA